MGVNLVPGFINYIRLNIKLTNVQYLMFVFHPDQSSGWFKPVGFEAMIGFPGREIQP